jgi:hypothetical protein
LVEITTACEQEGEGQCVRAERDEAASMIHDFLLETGLTARTAGL